MGEENSFDNTLSWDKVDIMAVTKDGRIISLKNCDTKITTEGPKTKRKPFNQTYSMSFEYASIAGVFKHYRHTGNEQAINRCPRKLKKQLKKEYGSDWKSYWNEHRKY